MKVFEIAGKLYAKVTPTKTLFHSTMVHEVVNRGDIFAIRLEDNALTVVDGKLADAADWFHVALMPMPAPTPKPVAVVKKTDTVTVAKMKAEMKKELAKVDKVLANAQQLLSGM